MSAREADGAGANAWLWVLAGGLYAAAATTPRARTLVASARPGRAQTPTEFLTNASAHELRSLPGVGPARALAIARWRWHNGGVVTVDDLESVPNIGPETRAAIETAIRERVHAGGNDAAAAVPAR